MTDLTGIIKQHAPEQVIDTMREANYTSRAWLGLSQAGHKCPRWLWYCHRGFEAIPPEGRMLRLFDFGKAIEDLIVLDLKQAGYCITSAQKMVTFTWDDLVLNGHIDGIITGLIESGQPHLLEIKTSNRKRFEALIKCGSYELWDEKYKFQIHAYMLGLKLKRCLVMVCCKDSSRLYSERIKLDNAWITDRLACVFAAIGGDMPAGTCPNLSWFERKFCAYRKYCN